jgi:hypothetical protein
MIISIPQRHDLSTKSCVNKEILSFNSKLHKLMKNKELVKVLDCDIPRDGFTRHGQHHNNKGKTMLALQIMQELTSLTKDSSINPNPIPMAWAKPSPDPTTNGSATEPTTKVQSECVCVDIKEVIRQPINNVNAISEDSENESNNPNNRTSASDPTPSGSEPDPTTT